MLQIAVTGKPNVGKSSFFNSATSSSVEMANYPFTTIDANKAVAHVISECPCKELNVTCNPRNSICIDGKRLLPVELIDVAGLVPGAHEGKGLGNQFLDDLMQAKVLIHVIDASGSTDAEGQSVEAGSHDPLDDIEFLEDEIVMWMYGILNRNWVRLVRKIEAEKLDIAKVIFDQLSGTGITLEDIIEAKRKVNPDYTKWEKEDFMELIRNILHIAKPMLIVANKADLPTAEENIKRMQEKYPYVIPASAESEIALVKAAESGLIRYTPGDSDFEILEKDKLSDNQLKALEMAGLQPVSSNIEVPDSLKESDPLMAEVLDIQSKAKYTYGQNQAYWYQNVIDTFSTQLPELAYGNITAKEFCQKLTDAAKKN